MALLYIKYTSFVSCCCREEFFMYFHYMSMVDNDMPGPWGVACMDLGHRWQHL